METATLDQARAEAFGNRMLDILNGGAMAIMVSIGHRTGLFDTMSELDYADSHEIAEKAGLNERYVREWLGAMTVGRIIDVDPTGPKYILPQEHAGFLSRKSPSENIAVYAQYIPELGSIQEKIIDCFKNGGGVPYEDFPRFHDVMAEDSGQTVLPALFDHILPLAPGVITALEEGIEVLDIGCGSGRALNKMAERFPNSRFTGYDLSQEAIRRANKEKNDKGLRNIRFEAKDLTYFSEPKRYDLITAFDAVHDQAKPESVLRGVFSSLKDDGIFLMQDIAGSSHVHNNLDHPIAPLLYTVSTLHCMTVSLAQGGDGYGAMWGEEKALELLKRVGFAKVKTSKLAHDLQNNYYVASKN